MGVVLHYDLLSIVHGSPIQLEVVGLVTLKVLDLLFFFGGGGSNNLFQSPNPPSLLQKSVPISECLGFFYQ